MMARQKKEVYVEDNTVQYVRGVIVYICILCLFGSVILLVHAGMEEKRVRYEITKRIGDKRILMDEIRKLDNRIAEMESFERIAEKVKEHFPDLKPPQHPAISIAVDGLSNTARNNQRIPALYEDRSWLGNLRHKWRNLEQHVQDYINRLVE